MRVKRFVIIAAVAIVASLSAGSPSADASGLPQVREVLAYRGNYTARSSRAIRRIVIHTVEGSEAGCISWFQNPRARVSAHYVVSHAGRITRMVPDMSVAWHATVYNGDSIGIENEGYAGRDTWTSAQYEALAHLVRGLCDRYGIPKTRQAIVGHSQVPGSGKSDPGRYFDWDRFLGLVRGSGGGAGSGSSAGTPAPAPTPPSASSGRFGVEVTASALNVRAAPGGQVLGQVNRGDRFVATGQQAGWLRIDFGGRDAWISGSFARRVGAGQAEVVTATSLNVRSTPSTSGTILGQSSRDQVHYRLGESGDWVLVQFDRRQGWVRGDYTQTVSLP